MTRSERGQTLPLMSLLLWCLAGAALLVLLAGDRAADRARAQTAADAAALAEAAAPGRGVPLAGANGHGVVIDAAGNRVVARAATGPVGAVAAAEADPVSWAGLHPELVGAIRRAEQLLGTPVPIVSGFRTRAEQEALWAAAASNPYPVARPGTSLHERGLAIDVPLEFVPHLRGVAGSIGLCQPLPTTDPVHFTLCVMPSP